jgi:hypothetical protein
MIAVLSPKVLRSLWTVETSLSRDRASVTTRRRGGTAAGVVEAELAGVAVLLPFSSAATA